MDNLVTWMLTFGDKAELLEPKEAREKIRNIVEAMERNYS
jgi:predicted DNA-binding transcriptional regulator YafY